MPAIKRLVSCGKVPHIRNTTLTKNEKKLYNEYLLTLRSVTPYATLIIKD